MEHPKQINKIILPLNSAGDLSLDHLEDPEDLGLSREVVVAPDQNQEGQ